MMDIRKNKSSHILDYVLGNNEPFERVPFNEVDALIFSQLSYFHMEGLVPSLADDQPWVPLYAIYKAEWFDQLMAQNFDPPKDHTLLSTLCASARFRDIQLNYYVSISDKETEEQFSAVSFLLPNQTQVIAFRGTDATITGWKEDFNMFYMSPVPCQLSAVAYLEDIANKTPHPFYVVGHSKGGNLAAYSTAFCSKESYQRILSSYNLDGPGFPVDIVDTSHPIDEEKKIGKWTPEGSIIGVMLQNDEETSIVKSSNFSVWQHAPYSWMVEGEAFVKSDGYTAGIQFMDKTLNRWVYDLDIEHRKIFVDTVFSIIDTTNAESPSEIAKLALKEREALVQMMKDLDPETTKCIREVLLRLLKASFESGVERFKKERDPSEESFVREMLTRVFGGEKG